jgi:alkylation response protein AidB-like acyl-CoA dehydrogenase
MGVMVEAAHEVADLLRLEADTSEQGRRLSLTTVEALRSAGLLRMCVPAVYGGPEVTPMELVSAIREVAISDGAAGWCTMIASTTASMSMFLAPEVAAKIFGDPRVVAGGVFAPNGTGTRVGDGFSVSGRWQWGSGTQHCDWVLGGARCDDDTFRLCFTPVANVEFHDTWYTMGMRGSGSLDFSFSDVFVPADHTMQPGLTRPTVDLPLARFPNFTLLGAGVAAVGAGVAERALSELAVMADTKKPQYSTRTLANSAYTQIEYAKALAALRAAQAYLLDELATAWDLATRGEAVNDHRRVQIRLAATHLALTAAAATDTAFTLAGGAAVYDTSVLGRCLRDAHVVTQHVMTAPKLLETFGRFLLGVETDTRMI